MSHRDPAEDPLLEGAGQPHLPKFAERMGGDDSIAEARQRLEAHMDNSPLAVIEFDARFRIVRWSGGAQRMFGWTAAEALDRSVSDLRWVHEDDSESVRRLIAGMLGGACPRNRHVNRNYRKDGVVVHCEWYNSVIYDEQGRLMSIFSQVLDVTERKAVDERLRRSQAQLRSMIRHAPISIAMFDRDMRYLVTSGRWLREHGRGHPDLVGLNHYQVLSDLPSEWKLVHQQGLAGETVTNDEDLWIQADGSRMWLRWAVQPWIDDNGAIGGIIVSFEDITEYKLADKALRDADRRKDEFLAILAHELRNPLAPIRSAVEILKLTDSPDAPSRRARELIERQLQHLERLVDDLMDRNRITLGRLHLRREHLDLVRVLEQAIECVQHKLRCAEQVLTCELPPESIYLNADLIRLEQVFVNLLDNACKYTGRGGRIGLTAEREGTDVVVKVTDTGIGIPPEQLPRLFEMFVQMSSESARSRGGLGIGLAIARELVEMHGGRIVAKSAGSGKGAEFVVRLPISTEVSEPPSPLPKERGNKAPTAVRRILVVDDNPDVVESLALLLRVSGYEVDTAHDGFEAVQAAARARPDLVFLDIGMPGMDGYTACRSMRAHPGGKDLAIFAMTGWGQEEDHRKTREAGFSGHLVKPVDHAALQRLLVDPGVPRG